MLIEKLVPDLFLTHLEPVLPSSSKQYAGDMEVYLQEGLLKYKSVAMVPPSTGPGVDGSGSAAGTDSGSGVREVWLVEGVVMLVWRLVMWMRQILLLT